MSFSEESLIKKFQDLTNTQQSVQTLSLWLIHHRKHAKTIVTIWLKELLNEKKAERKLTFLYLANDILQNSRKKGQEYQNEFTKNVLLEAIQNTSLISDSKIRFSLERILNIWKDRKIFTDDCIDKFKNALDNPDKIKIENLDDNILRSPPTINNNNLNESPTVKNLKKINKKSSNSDNDGDDDDDLIKKKRKINNDTTTAKYVSFISTEIDKEAAFDLKTPDSLELVSMLRNLEQSASSDAIVRGKIAELPGHISDINYVNKIKDNHSELFDFNRKLNDALVLLDEYNQRLNDELLQRKQTTLLLTAFIKEQQKQFEFDKQILNDWKIKIKQVENFKNEFKNHLHSLPDLKIINEVTELPPLPTANDLFSN